jgi:hypothetical protein
MTEAKPKTVGEFRKFLERFDPDLPLEITSDRCWDTSNWTESVYEAVDWRNGEHYVSIGCWKRSDPDSGSVYSIEKEAKK